MTFRAKQTPLANSGSDGKIDPSTGSAIPANDPGGLSLAAVNRMIAGAIRGVRAREQRRR